MGRIAGLLLVLESLWSTPLISPTAGLGPSPSLRLSPSCALEAPNFAISISIGSALPHSRRSAGAKKIEHIQVTDIGIGDFTWENVQFVKELTRSCTWLNTILVHRSEEDDPWEVSPDEDHLSAFLKELGVAREEFDPFDDRLMDARWFAGEGL
ncbi:hypothetical protein BDK51DRAFT_41823 [Blyttiomyces helicus]|uniref:Uncharacterized protein n=1 Tax=Blyttiomyces helicus TaxID=388810 RepID=A0A4P9W7K2_9FUNG|nr:hypothetical protein BDK51DRAFT_41823 [Blyttiomyces helicus]|eukprot:RKO88449.1 hypothetical protein BDK51DRAFT_41823 [Blyttiomyces helicus]